MKKVIFGTALASMALLSACSSDNELANVGTTANNAIGLVRKTRSRYSNSFTEFHMRMALKDMASV